MAFGLTKDNICLFLGEGLKMKRLLYGTLFVLVSIAVVCFAAPTPAIVPAQSEWTAEIRFEHLQQIELQTKANKPLRFWYTIITVTNKTKNEVDFYPQCALMTDTFQIISAGKSVTPAVFELIKRRHQRKYPFLDLLEKVDNKLLPGQDNTTDFDRKAKAVKLFISGLSNETVVIDHPIAKDKSGMPVKVFLRKTLELSYDIAGDPALRSRAKVTYKDNRWVMR
jgi:hypothetical protein